jgi:hypothetical protein
LIEPRSNGWSNPLQHRLFEALLTWATTDGEADSDRLFSMRGQIAAERAIRYAQGLGWMPPEDAPAPSPQPLPGQLELQFGQVLETRRPRAVRLRARHPLEATYGGG